MGLLDFLNTPKWKEIEKSVTVKDSIKAVEAEYWWIDESEPLVSQVDLPEFFYQCLNCYTEIARELGLLSNRVINCDDLLPVGQRVVHEYLYDRYLVQRHESDPDIFYSYVTGISFEAGLTIANKWKHSPSDLESYIDKIIRETPMEEICDIYQQHLNIASERDWLTIESRVSAPFYDLLKWYYQRENFESYKHQALLAVFQLGVIIILDRTT